MAGGIFVWVKILLFCYLGSNAKFLNPTIIFENTPLVPQICHYDSAGGRRAPRFFLLLVGILLFLLVRANVNFWNPTTIFEIVAYLSCSAGRTYFARTKIFEVVAPLY